MNKLLLAVSTICLAGCTVTQQAQLPSVQLSPQWRAGSSAAGTEAAWWSAFGDATLNGLEKQALTDNLDLLQAHSRIEQARAATGLVEAMLAPAVNLEGSAGTVKQSLNTGLGTLAKYVPDYARKSDHGQVTLSGTWDLDFAQGLRRQRDATAASLEAQVAELEALRVAISVEVADGYFSAVGTWLQHVALKKQLQLLEAQTHIMDVRVHAGAAAPIELDRLHAAKAEASAALPALAAGIAIHKNRLALLLGRNPSDWGLAFGATTMMPAAFDPAGGLPADIVRRRPDVLAAEKRVAGARAAVAAALAVYYPQISLSAALGQESNDYSSLGSVRSSFAQSFLGVRWRLFDFGRIDAEVNVAKGRQRESLLAYRSAVLRAAAEVESGFSQLAGTRQRLRHLEEQAVHIRQIAQTVHRALQAGAASEDDMLGADRNVAQADFDIAAARADVSHAIALTARALGGPME